MFAIRSIAKTSNKKLLTISITALDKFIFTIKKQKLGTVKCNQSSVKIVKSLRKDGFYIYENYLTTKECELIKSEIDNFTVQFPEFINTYAKSDIRFFGAENLSKNIHRFSSDTNLELIANSYNKFSTKNAFTLAAKMTFKQGNLGSGEGWHRDAIFKQFKAIVYLTDVTDKNGPFQIIQNSQKTFQTLIDIWTAKLNYNQNRIFENEIFLLLKKNEDRLKTITAKAGTLILVDTSAIHRGKPIETGERYALTNYYFELERINSDLFEQFAPIAGIMDKNKMLIKQ